VNSESSANGRLTNVQRVNVDTTIGKAFNFLYLFSTVITTNVPLSILFEHTFRAAAEAIGSLVCVLMAINTRSTRLRLLCDGRSR
jgi:hypothetical protein